MTDKEDDRDKEHDAMQLLCEHPENWAEIGRLLGVRVDGPATAEALISKGEGKYWTHIGRIDLIGKVDNRASNLVREMRDYGWVLSVNEDGGLYAKNDNPYEKINKRWEETLNAIAAEVIAEVMIPNVRPRNGALALEIKSGRIPIGRVISQVRMYREQQCTGEWAGMARCALWAVVAKEEHCDAGTEDMLARQEIKVVRLGGTMRETFEKRCARASGSNDAYDPVFVDLFAMAIWHPFEVMSELERLFASHGVWSAVEVAYGTGQGTADMAKAYLHLKDAALAHPTLRRVQIIEGLRKKVPVLAHVVEQRVLDMPHMAAPNWREAADLHISWAILRQRMSDRAEKQANA